MRAEPIWITERMAIAIHNQQIVLFGGVKGILDQGKLSSALARPKQLYTYQPDSSIYQLAATLGWGLANNHPFVDGNKRTAFVVMAVFLKVNEIDLIAHEVEVVNTMLALAAGTMSEEQLSVWLKSQSKQE